MLTVGNNTAGVEELLGNGLLSCPGCGGRLGGWGHAARRPVFRVGRDMIPVAVRPRRARCASCGVTHVLLPAWLLSRRCDGTAVIGDMLARAARGEGFRKIASVSGGPEGTVRGRLRRFRGSAGRVREFFTRLAGVLAVDPVPLDPAGSVLGDAVVAVAAVVAAARGGAGRALVRELDHVHCVPRWQQDPTFAQVTAVSPGACKTVGLAYVGSNPTPAAS